VGEVTKAMIVSTTGSSSFHAPMIASAGERPSTSRRVQLELMADRFSKCCLRGRMAEFRAMKSRIF